MKNLKNTSTHQLYFDNEEELSNFKPEEYFQTNEEFLKKKTNRVKTNQLYKLTKPKDDNENKKLLTLKKLQYKKLTEKMKNVNDLNNISNALAYQKELIVN